MSRDNYLSNETKLEIGKLVYTQEITKSAAATQYDIKTSTVIECVRYYLKSENIEAIPSEYKPCEVEKPNYMDMSKEELIKEIMKKDIEVARAKKGYSVKGGGKEREYNILSNASSK